MEIIDIAIGHGHDPVVAMELAIAQVKLEKASYDVIKATVESKNHEAFFWSRLDVVRRHMTEPLIEPLAEEPQLNLKQEALPYGLQVMLVKRKASWNAAKVGREEIEAIRSRGKHHDSIPIPDDVQRIKPNPEIAKLYMDEVEARQQAARLRQQIKKNSDRLSRRSLKLRRQQQQQLSAQKRQLEQLANEQPAEKRTRQDNASPAMQYDGPDVECEVSLDQDPVAVNPTAVETQQVDTFPLKITTFSVSFKQ